MLLSRNDKNGRTGMVSDEIIFVNLTKREAIELAHHILDTHVNADNDGWFTFHDGHSNQVSIHISDK